MSQNKFMHPRNIYRKPPDFKALAIKYPDFRKYAKQDISGKVSLDFKNLESVRALTSTLLKEDFNLEVEIPLDRLIPTLPLRLNYLLWIEDILRLNSIKGVVKGIDIGCGASCVYPLLAAKQFQWVMLATEKDTTSAEIAKNNVLKNNLQDKIKVKTAGEGCVLEGVLESDSGYDFSMCNPPFFSCMEELKPDHVARSPSRHPPRNAHSGTPGELVAPGGETAFVTQIIQESVKLNNLIRIYTVMLGHKSSVNKVKQVLQEAGVTKMAVSEFCQGRTTRWGVAWSLDPEIVLSVAKDNPLSNKKKVPFSYVCNIDLTSTVQRLHQLMNKLQITYSTLKNNTELNAMEISARMNTWSNSRRARRQEKLRQRDQEEKNSEQMSPDKLGINVEKTMDHAMGEKLEGSLEKDNVDLVTECKNKMELITDSEKLNGNSECKKKRSRSDDGDSSDLKASKMLKTEINNSESCSSVKNSPFMKGSLVVRKKGEESVIELCWLHGEGGRDAAHQVLQYFKNNLDAH